VSHSKLQLFNKGVSIRTILQGFRDSRFLPQNQDFVIWRFRRQFPIAKVTDLDAQISADLMWLRVDAAEGRDPPETRRVAVMHWDLKEPRKGCFDTSWIAVRLDELIGAVFDRIKTPFRQCRLAIVPDLSEAMPVPRRLPRLTESVAAAAARLAKPEKFSFVVCHNWGEWRRPIPKPFEIRLTTVPASPIA
jgi:hypothetical protein